MLIWVNWETFSRDSQQGDVPPRSSFQRKPWCPAIRNAFSRQPPAISCSGSVSTAETSKMTFFPAWLTSSDWEEWDSKNLATLSWCRTPLKAVIFLDHPIWSGLHKGPTFLSAQAFFLSLFSWVLILNDHFTHLIVFSAFVPVEGNLWQKGYDTENRHINVDMSTGEWLP